MKVLVKKNFVCFSVLLKYKRPKKIFEIKCPISFKKNGKKILSRFLLKGRLFMNEGKYS